MEFYKIEVEGSSFQVAVTSIEQLKDSIRQTKELGWKVLHVWQLVEVHGYHEED